MEQCESIRRSESENLCVYESKRERQKDRVRKRVEDKSGVLVREKSEGW